MAIPVSTRFYRYVVESLDIIFPNEGIHYTIDGRLVLGLLIERDYDKDMFPVMKLDLSLDTTMYHKIIANNTSVKFRLRIQKYIYSEDSKIVMKQDIINDVFVTFMDENTPFLDKKTFDAASELNSAASTKGKTPITVGGNNVSFYLFKEKDIILSKKIVNDVLANATITDAIAYLLATTGFVNTLMTPLDNTSAYNEIIIPPLTLQGCLMYLENQYGFYHKGSVIFFDLPALYIISKNSRATAWRRGENYKVIFSVKNSDNPNQFSTGSYFDEDQRSTFINIRPSDLNASTVSVVRDQIEGNHRLIINPALGSVNDLKTNTNQRGSGTYKILVNKYNNQFINSAEKTRIESDGQTFNVALMDVDFDAIAPNKEYSFKFEDGEIHKEYGGNYRLNNSAIYFQNEGEHFKMKATLLFKK